MTDTSYLYEYFLVNSPEPEEAPEPHEQAKDLEENDNSAK